MKAQGIRQGFTLVELLVVIAIIGILVGCYYRPCKRRVKRLDVCNAAITSSRLGLEFITITRRTICFRSKGAEQVRGRCITS